MPSTSEIAKLYGFIAKETPAATHAFNAGAGMAARGAYNLVTGRDLTDGMIGAGVLGAAGGVGLKTYRNAGRAGVVAGALGKLETATTRAAKMAPARSLFQEARAMGVRAPRALRSARPVQQGGSAVTEALQKVAQHEHSVMKANQPVNAKPGMIQRGKDYLNRRAVLKDVLKQREKGPFLPKEYYAKSAGISAGPVAMPVNPAAGPSGMAGLGVTPLSPSTPRMPGSSSLAGNPYQAPTRLSRRDKKMAKRATRASA